MSKKIVLAGGTGFIGRHLEERFAGRGYQVVIISRQQGHISWSNKAAIIAALEGAEMLINLAGKSVDCRYTPENKKAILLSRTETTKTLGEAILLCKSPPLLWINSGTGTIYRHATDRPMTEANGDIGDGFSVSVATAWEKSFFDFKLPHTRQVVLRIAIVLGNDGGALKPLVSLVKLGLGGRQGRGDQKMSWLHVADLCGIIEFVQEKKDITGVLNCASPQTSDNTTLMATLRKVLNRKIGLPSPEWLLTIGAYVIRTEPELILKSRWVMPERLLNEGFVFQFPALESALKDLLRSTK
jgi:uncharacterized protein (TIGR01777 family)